MLTVREFAGAADRHLCRVMRWFGLPLFLLLVGVGVTLNWFVDPEPWLRTHVHPDWPAWVIDPLALIAIYTICLPALWPIHALARRDPRLVCPHCDRGLYRSRFRVVATRKCPRCCREILTDSDLPRPVPHTREEVAALAAPARRATLAVALGLPVAWAATVGSIFGAIYLKNVGVISELLASWVAGAGALAFFAWMIWLFVQATRLLRLLVPCPRCSRRMSPRSVLKFGRCVECSQPLVREGPTGGVAAETGAG